MDVKAHLMHQRSLFHSVLNLVDHIQVVMRNFMILDDEINERDVSVLINQTLAFFIETVRSD